MSALTTAANRVIKQLRDDRDLLLQAREAARSGDTEKAIQLLLSEPEKDQTHS